MTKIACCLSAIALLLSNAGTASAVIVNIDLEGFRTAGGGNNGVPPKTFIGVGAAGGGNIFNSVQLSAVSDNSNSTTTGDNQTLTAASLLDSNGVVTGLGFTIGPIGVDNETNAVATDPSALFDDYVFNHSAGNNTDATFSFSGLTPNASYHVYTYGNNRPSTVITGGTSIPFVGGGNFGPSNTVDWLVTADGSGVISGSLGAGVNVFGGLSIASVPEPSSVIMLGVGAIGLVLAARRRKA